MMFITSRLSVRLLVVCWGVATLGWLGALAAEEPAATASPSMTASERIAAALEKVDDWLYIDQPLLDVVQDLQHLTGIDIVLDARALDDIGVDTQTLITRNIERISLRSFLRVALSDLNLTYTVRYGALWITSLENVGIETRVYPINDLLPAASIRDEQPHDHSNMAKAIQTVISPESWRQVGGPGTVEYLWGSLIVTQTTDVHEQIELLLKAWRELVAAQREAHGAELPAILLEPPGNAKIRAALAVPLTATFVDTPLTDAIEQISSEMAMPILVDVLALEEVGIDSQTMVSGEFQSLPLRDALSRLLLGLDLTFIVRDEVLTITTREMFEEKTLIGLYPVGDLLPTQGESPISDELTALREVIMRSIATDHWAHVGGAGDITTLGDTQALVVSQSEDIHEQISEMLDQLRGAATRNALSVEQQPDTSDPFVAPLRSYPVYMNPQSARRLTILIQRECSPGTWRVADGNFVELLENMIVVKHTAEVHKQVQQLLKELGVSTPSLKRSDRQKLEGGSYSPF